MDVNIYGPNPFRLSILPLPGAEDVARQFVSQFAAPPDWEFAVGLPELDPLDAMVVQDEDGESLRVLYADLGAKVIQSRSGTVEIVLSLDADFDLSGPHAHLYHAVAHNVVNTIWVAGPTF